ncbi:restriction endonuclease subunit S [Pseudoalteromonas sp. S4389]|uniref:restriction endonuclease subunit S n=1 Tax=Pseudoalteromonas sp. S4389 TaxID=579556 RepID=UPI0011087768|nr:restriction endonuclease subunit S [Pseudoalteromonas sp. S4389]TMO43991.1 restriction endonuclease subunit S [Pseudoalteromonas sp. S4389]
MTGRYKAYPEYKDSGSIWFDAIPLSWQAILLKRVVLAIKDGTHGTYARVSEGMPLLSAKNVFSNGIYISESESQISLEHHEEIVRNGFPAKGDLLITCVGTVGRAFVYDREKPVSFQRSVAFVRFKGNAFPQYYKYYVESKPYQSQLKSLIKASAQGGVYMGDLVATESLLPPYIEQKKIANFLDYETSKIDTLIAKQEKLIELLKEKRQAVISHAVTKGLPSVNGEADAPMKDSGVEWLGEVPEHWVVSKFAYLKTVLTDYTANGSFADLKANVEYKDSPSFARLVRLTDLRVDLQNDNGVWIDEDSYKYLRKSALHGGEFLLANVGAYAGLFYQMPFNKGPASLAPNMFMAKFNTTQVKREFMAYVGQSDGVASQLKLSATAASAQPKLNKDDFKSVRFTFPCMGEQQEIIDYLNIELPKLDLLMSKQAKAIELMKERKTALISAAVTGKIDVRDWKVGGSS